MLPTVNNLECHTNIKNTDLLNKLRPGADDARDETVQT